MSYKSLIERLTEVTYLPILSVRPAEMKALEELPEHDKNLMLPMVILRPWLNASEFVNSLEKLEEVYGERSFIGDLDHDYDFPDEDLKPAALQLKTLMDSADGFKSWREFVVSHPQLIPVLQIGAPEDITAQIVEFNQLGRGIVLRLPKSGFSGLSAILKTLKGVNPLSLLFLFDFGKPRSGDLVSIASCDSLVKLAAAEFPGCGLSVSATTFPEDFQGRDESKIEEREFYKLLCDANPTLRIYYSDWGSARAERNGGGGRIVPRVDYPVFGKWYFFRKDQGEKNPIQPGYEEAANELINNKPVWQPVMPIWGTQMIERTAKGDKFAIVSPVRATAVRINLHMHRQIHFDNQKQAFEEMDDEWVD
jgi:Beta protein